MDDLDKRIKKILEGYGEEIAADMETIAKKLAKAGAKQINTNAVGMFKGYKYAKSWGVTEEKSRLGPKLTIHSGMPGLPHLLENGHASRKGGRFVPGRPHIAQVEEELVKKYQEEVIDAIQGR